MYSSIRYRVLHVYFLSSPHKRSETTHRTPQSPHTGGCVPTSRVRRDRLISSDFAFSYIVHLELKDSRRDNMTAAVRVVLYSSSTAVYFRSYFGYA